MPSLVLSESNTIPACRRNSRNANDMKSFLQPTMQKTLSTDPAMAAITKSMGNLHRSASNISVSMPLGACSMSLARTKSLQRGNSYLQRTMTEESNVSNLNAMAQELLARSRSEQPEFIDVNTKRSEAFNKEHNMLKVLHAPDDFPVRYRSSAYPKECSTRRSSACISRASRKTDLHRETVGRETHVDEADNITATGGLLLNALSRDGAAEEAVVSESGSGSTLQRNKKSVVVLPGDDFQFDSNQSNLGDSSSNPGSNGSNTSLPATVSSAGNNTTNVVLPAGMDALTGNVVLVDALGNTLGTVNINALNGLNGTAPPPNSVNTNNLSSPSVFNRMSMPTATSGGTGNVNTNSTAMPQPQFGPLAAQQQQQRQSAFSHVNFQSTPNLFGNQAMNNPLGNSSSNVMQLQPLPHDSFVSAGSIHLPRTTTMNTATAMGTLTSNNASFRQSVSQINANINATLNDMNPVNDASARLSTVNPSQQFGSPFPGATNGCVSNGNNAYLQSSTAGNAMSPQSMMPTTPPLGSTRMTSNSNTAVNSACNTPMHGASPMHSGSGFRFSNNCGTPQGAFNTPPSSFSQSFPSMQNNMNTTSPYDSTPTSMHSNYSGDYNKTPTFMPIPGTQAVTYNAPEHMETWMLRNIPCRFDQEEVMRILDSVGLEGRYNFFYLPIDIKKTAFRPKKSNANNKGYAFINLKDAKDSDLLFQICHEQRFWDGHWKSNSRKNCQVKPAKNQGFVANVMFYKTEVLDKGAYNCETGKNTMRKGSDLSSPRGFGYENELVEGDRVQKMLQDVAQTPYIEYPTDAFKNSDEYVLAIAAQIEGGNAGVYHCQ